MDGSPGFAFQIKKIILEQSKRANVGHIGPALSIADLIAALYERVLNILSPEDPERDRFILSKGHAALALYAALYLRGWISQADLNTYCSDGTLLGVHPECELRGVDFASGSLGQGLSMGVGSALAARLQGSPRRTYVLVSDAECDEGSLWEAVMSAAHFKLGTLVAIVDVNGQQALGYTDQVLDLAPLSARWQAFGWDTHEVDGHDPIEIARTLSSLDTSAGRPHALIAHTISGKGVSFMERQIKWHYWPMSEKEYRQALEEIGAGA
jgi:transketolase